MGISLTLGLNYYILFVSKRPWVVQQYIGAGYEEGSV